MQMRGGWREHIGDLSRQHAKHFANLAAGLIWRDGSDTENHADDRLVSFIADNVAQCIGVGEQTEFSCVEHGVK